MTVLRSREVNSVPTKPKPKTLRKQSNIEPATPSQTREPSPNRESVGLHSGSVSVSGSTRRRSVRLASKLVFDECSSERNTGKKIDSRVSGNESNKEDTGVGSVEEGVRVLGGKEGTRRKRKWELNANFSGFEDDESKGVLSLRSGKRIAKRRVENGGDDKVLNEKEREVKNRGHCNLVDSGLVVDGELDFEPEANNSKDNVKGRGEDKKKGKRVLRGASEDGVAIEKLEKSQSVNEPSTVKRRRRFNREEKGKAKSVEDGSLSKDDEKMKPGLESQVKKKKKRGNESRSEQFRDIAKQNASRFAHFNFQEEEVNHLSVETAREISDVEVEGEIEDWPGPFSTAMKIIRDRTVKQNLQQGSSSSDKFKSVPVLWVPKRGHGRDHSKPLAPSLRELCMKVLFKNADSITSLEYVPDALRHQLSQVLCDSRKMNAQILDLLVSGSPTEIRLRDCSWLTEEQFTQCFEGCDISNLTVLQLDHCGRCMPDYILPSTLARSSNSLPVLTTLSLSGACRLSDVGLHSLLSSTPVLRSLNLSQCSLLSPASIDTLADLLGSVLRELYITDCQSIDAMLIMPALKKLEHLEVLSVAGMQTVSDRFVREFVTARGHNMKELILTDCVKLTDSSVKVIAETCPGLCALDLVNLCKLTDSTLGFLANGCRAMQILKLCRSSFSDEAVAAFLETSGEFLKELSLNNVKKVGHNTALSLARRSRNLRSLDLSWCRHLTNDAVGLIVDSCLSLRVLKLFGCTQITNVFLDGHSNPDVQIIGLKMSPVLEHLKVPDPQEAPLHYSSVSSLM